MLNQAKRPEFNLLPSTFVSPVTYEISRAYRTVNAHVRYRFRQWWSAKHKRRAAGPQWYWSPWLEKTYGLLQLRWDPARLPKANA